MAALDLVRRLLEAEEDLDADFDVESFVARMPWSPYVLEKWFKEQRGHSRYWEFEWHPNGDPSHPFCLVYSTTNGAVFAALTYTLDTEQAPDGSEGLLEFKYYGHMEPPIYYFSRRMTVRKACAMVRHIHATVANSNGTKSGISWQLQRLQGAFDDYRVGGEVTEAEEHVCQPALAKLAVFLSNVDTGCVNEAADPDVPETFLRQHLQAQQDALDQFDARFQELGWLKHQVIVLNEYHYRKPTNDRCGFLDVYIYSNLGSLHMRCWGLKNLFGADERGHDVSTEAEWEVPGMDIPVGMTPKDFADMVNEEVLTSDKEPTDEQFENFWREPEPYDDDWHDDD